jgi:nucleotide-binding universal stress UspA family protein
MKIILPTDFSKNARSAIEYAIGMFSYEDVEYILLNTFEDPYTTTDIIISIKDILSRQSKEGLKKEYDYFKKKYPSDLFVLKKQTKFGKLSDAINSISKNENIDYVVMGTKGSSGMENVFLGSTTLDVIKKTNCPTLVIPENTIYAPPLKIALATDYNELKNNTAFNPLTKIAKQYNSEILIVNVSSEAELVSPKEEINGINMHYTLEKIPHHFYDITHVDIVEGLVQFNHKHDVDMIALISRHHSFFERIFHNSITKQLTKLADVPLLILHE